MKDFILGLCFMVLGGITIYVAQQYPTMPSLQYGPSLFPSLIGGGFLIGGLVLAATRLKAFGQQFASMRRSGSELTINYRALLLPLLPCVLIVFYIFSSDTLGAALTLAIIMCLLMLVRGTPLLLTLAVSIVASLIIYMLFSRYLLIPLPEGFMSYWG